MTIFTCAPSPAPPCRSKPTNAPRLEIAFGTSAAASFKPPTWPIATRPGFTPADSNTSNCSRAPFAEVRMGDDGEVRCSMSLSDRAEYLTLIGRHHIPSADLTEHPDRLRFRLPDQFRADLVFTPRSGLRRIEGLRVVTAAGHDGQAGFSGDPLE